MSDLTITAREPSATVAHMPARLRDGRDVTYYIVSCEHGTTQLHELNGTDPAIVTDNLTKQHNRRLGCTCRPS